MEDTAVLDAAVESTPVAEVSVPDTVVETPTTEEVTPAVDTTEPTTETTDESKTVTDKPVADKPVAVSNAKVVESLREIQKTDPALARRLYEDVKYSNDVKRLLHELVPDAKSIAEAKEALANRVSPATQEYIDSVAQTDSLLYAGGDSHAELAQNIVDDLTSELGDAQGKERFGELTTSLLSKLKETDTAAHTAIVRGTFLDAAEQSGMIPALNQLNQALHAGNTAKAKAVMSDIIKFMQSEITAERNGVNAKTQAAAQRETQATAARELQGTAQREAQSITNRIIGNAFGELLRGSLKSLDRPAQEAFAIALQTELNAELSKDKAYQQTLKGVRSATTKTALLRKHEAVLKARAQDIVKQVAMQRHPALMKPAVAKPVAKPVAPPTKTVTIGGKSQTVFQLSKRPNNLVRTDSEMFGRIYTSSDLELLQASKGIGLVPSKSGKGHVFVQWKR